MRSMNIMTIGAALLGSVTYAATCTQTTQSLGIQITGEAYAVILSKNTVLPISKSRTFSTATDNQTSVVISVYQGASSTVSNDKLLGTFQLDGIPAAPKGVPEIVVNFDLGQNEILTVTATDRSAGVSSSATFSGVC